MKTLIYLLVALSWSMPGLAAEAPKPKPIEVAAGEDFEIKLQSELRTDYQWLLAKPLDPALLKYIRTTFRRPLPNSNEASGSEILRFKAVGIGDTAVHLKYCQVRGTSVPSIRTTNFVIRISKVLARQQE